MKKFTPNAKQKNALEAIYYWIHQSYLSNLEGDTEDCERCRKTLELCFEIADKANVPFWVQNKVIAEAQNRNTKYFDTVIKELSL